MHASPLAKKTVLNSQQVDREVLHIPHHQGNADQTSMSYTGHLSGRLVSERQRTGAGEDGEKREPCALLGTQTGAAIVENGMKIPQGIKN